MNELLAKLSSYNLFNYLLPGVLFTVLVERWSPYRYSTGDLLKDAFIYYFVGLAASRVGSVMLEPFLKKIRFVKFADYGDFVSASKKDPQVDILSETNNTFRTLLTACLLVLAVRVYVKAVTWWPWIAPRTPLMLIVGLTLLFLFAYRKQTSYVAKRVDRSK